jgi:LysM repeat protein
MVCLVLIPSLPLNAQDAPNTYVVQPGDTLFRIAVRFNTSVQALAQENGIADPTYIYAGQVLHIPAGGVPAPNPGAPAPSTVGNIAANAPGIPPIVGSVYYTALRLVAAGKRQGNRLDVFSKVGDSITANPVFLAPVGTGGLRLGGYTNLQGAVTFFSKTIARTNNSFANESLAAHGAWTTNDVLNPAQAAPGVCEGGETPLDCELRVTKPSVALIMFGSNDMRDVALEQFRANLNNIVAITERHGVIPVLSTTLGRKDIAEVASRTADYNAVIVQVARANSVPLWNYWQAASGLPNGGLSNDNLHPSMPYDNNTAIFDSDHLLAGINMRNLTAIQVLDALYRTVLH